jgi:hypothetical protein
VLVSSSPVGPGFWVGGSSGGFDDPAEEQALELVAGQRDKPGRWGCGGVFGGGQDGKALVKAAAARTRAALDAAIAAALDAVTAADVAGWFSLTPATSTDKLPENRCQKSDCRWLSRVGPSQVGGGMMRRMVSSGWAESWTPASWKAAR